MKKYSILLLSILVLCISCGKSDPEPDPIVSPPVIKSSTKAITKFVFTKADNPILASDVEGTIIGTDIKVVLSGIDRSSLKPTITFTASTISTPSGTARDFSTPQNYTLTADDGSTAIYTVNVSNSTVYAAGYEQNSNEKNVACYWKNGVKTALSDGSYSTELTGIFVSGTDIYACATENNIAVYWKNGVKVTLGVGASSSEARNIIVNGNDVYVVGAQRIAGGPRIAVYWKNGVVTSLSNGINQATAIAIAVVNSDIHVAGAYYPDTFTQNVVYWKNGNMVTIAEVPNQFSLISSMVVSGTDVYLTGQVALTNKYVYWKNGVISNLDLGNNGSYYMAIEGNDLYLVGARLGPMARNEVIYFKNSTLTSFTSNVLDDLKPYCISVLNTNVYIGGTYSLGGPATPQAVYWVNGKAVILSTQKSKVSAIVAK